MGVRTASLLVAATAIVAWTPAVGAAKWPEIPEADRSLIEVPGHPNAPAVVLLQTGVVHISEDRLSSYVDVYTRIKILTDEGVEYGTIVLDSSDYLRTKEIEGRTHLPDGRIAELGRDAVFEKEFSDYYDTVIVSCAMPEVVVGSIIEHHYRTYFDAIFFPREWYFQREIPTLRNEVVFELPKRVGYYTVEFNRLGPDKLQKVIDRNVLGGRVSYVMEDIPAVADEPHSFPFEDLTSKVLVLPGVDRTGRMPISLFDSWRSLLDVFYGFGNFGYRGFKKDSGAARKQARELADSAASPRQAAEAIYDWVRDEIEEEPYVGIFLGERRADEILKSRRGHYGEKPALLQVMLDSVGIEAHLGWTNPWQEGMLTPDIPNPSQFSSVIVVVELDGERVMLEPTDRRNAFGIVQPGLRGVSCLVVRTEKDTEWITIPELRPEESGRIAAVDYTLEAGGALRASGRLELTGARAWERLRWKNTVEATVDAWTAAVEGSFPGFDIDQLEVEENPAGPGVSVSWTMAQRGDEVLGDEAVIAISSPLSRSSHPFTLSPHERTTPVRLDYPITDRVQTTIVWPDGWSVAGEPALTSSESPVGRLTTSAEIDRESRRAVFRRELAVERSEIMSPRDYARLQALFSSAVANDAAGLLLVAE